MPRWFAYRSFRPQPEPIRAFADLGVDTVCVFPANTDSSLGVPYSPYPPIWTGPERYDWDSLRRHFDDVLAACPGGQLLCLVDLNTPTWWCRVTREPDSFYDLGRIAASPRYRRDVGEWLTAFLSYCQEQYAEAMAGYVLAGGCTTEWQDLSHAQESTSRNAAWRAWQAARGVAAPVDLPNATLRQRASHATLRDPVTDEVGVDTWRFTADLVGDVILHFAQVAQQTLQHRVPVGVFYGYCLEHGRTRLLDEGHLDFDRVFASPDLDFFISPGTYSDRASGGASGPMLPLGTLRRHGKAFLHEIDHRTHTARKVTDIGTILPGHGESDPAASVAGLRRELCVALLKGLSLWWFDMFGGWYDDPAVRAEVGRLKMVWDRLADHEGQPAAQVALVVDADSLYYLDGHSALADELLGQQRVGLGRIGAPYDVLSFADLAEVDLSPYRLLVFAGLFAVDEAKRQVLRERVCRDGRTVLWIGACGIIADGRWDPENVRRLTGHRHDIGAVASLDLGDWTSVYAPAPNLSAAELQRWCDAAGVHRYVATEDPVLATDRLVMIHTAAGGATRVRLRQRVARVVEVFSGQVVATDTAEFELALNAPDTVLLELVNEPAAGAA